MLRGESMLVREKKDMVWTLSEYRSYRCFLGLSTTWTALSRPKVFSAKTSIVSRGVGGLAPTQHLLNNVCGRAAFIPLQVFLDIYVKMLTYKL
jgi:hypothetical protein